VPLVLGTLSAWWILCISWVICAVAAPDFPEAESRPIMGVFMHMAWDPLTLGYVIRVSLLYLLVLVFLMAAEAEHTLVMRLLFFR
jgi:hypothetical protein